MIRHYLLEKMNDQEKPKQMIKWLLIFGSNDPKISSQRLRMSTDTIGVF